MRRCKEGDRPIETKRNYHLSQLRDIFGGDRRACFTHHDDNLGVTRRGVYSYARFLHGDHTAGNAADVNEKKMADIETTTKSPQLRPQASRVTLNRVICSDHGYRLETRDCLSPRSKTPASNG